MDVAVFVGFAASGPLNVPVPVDDPAHFASIFGTDAPLAWDRVRGAVQNAYLAPAVRSFFLNGGVRCWVVRVAKPGAINAFPVSGLLRSVRGQLTAATLVARSQGSWSDDLQVAGSLLSRPIEPAALDPAMELGRFPASLDVVPGALDDVVAGDLVRVSLQGDGDIRVAMIVVEQTVTVSTSTGTLRLLARVDANGQPMAWWFRAVPPGLWSGTSGAVRYGGADVAATLVAPPSVAALPQSTFAMATYSLQLGTSLPDAPAPGTMLEARFGTSVLWAMVHEAHSVTSLPGSPPLPQVVVTCSGLFVDSPWSGPTSSAIDLEIERLRVELWTRVAQATPSTLTDLGLDWSHPRAVWAVPSDEELFRPSDDPSAVNARAVELRQQADAVALLWSDAADPRFALACAEDPGVTFLPIGMPYTPDYPLGPSPTTDLPLKRDGLDTFDSSLFLDPDVAQMPIQMLLSEADFIRYQSPTPRRLTGIHAALGIDEATLIAVPDAALPGWCPADEPTLVPGAPAQPVVLGAGGSFVACNARPLDLPALIVGPVTPQGTFTLSWLPVRDAAQYEIQESADPTLESGVTSYTTTGTSLDVYGHAPGIVYVRGRATNGALDSGWSAASPIVVPFTSGYVVSEGNAPNPAPALLGVQTPLLAMCAARGDLFALLALPPFQTVVDAARYVSRLAAQQPDAALSFGAAYHPWIITRDQPTGPLTTTPPDGAMTGIHAKRALTRGAWVAPANEPLDDSVLGFSPRLPNDAWAVLDAQPVNRIRSEAHGMLAMSALTLASDVDYSPINVRRLLMLLRRAALSLGNRFVFEPNGDRLARSMQGTFTAMLDRLYRRGAFVGATANDAYRVVTDASVNPPDSIDLGRFVVELQVAPSLPLSFLTVRLVQSNGVLAVSGGS